MAIEINSALRRLVADRAYHVCEYCLVHEDDLFHACEMDHVVGLKHGGETAAENLAHACFHCNRHKGSDVGSISRANGEFTRFFNPRIDRWGDHFYISSGRIESLTAIGEVTVGILDFNHPDRVLLRRLLAEAGRFPSVDALARMKE
jgi:hypothetical protein